MSQRPATLETKSTLYVALELSDSSWKLSMCGSGQQKIRHRSVAAGDVSGLASEVRLAKQRLGLGEEAGVRSCYEAGRYGFALHRMLESWGVENVVVNPSSVRVPQHGRRAKTDRLDGEMLLRSLVRYTHGERGEWTVVRVPPVEIEDEREAHRELESLRVAANRERNQVTCLLLKCLGNKVSAEDVEKHGTGKLASLAGAPVPPRLQARIARGMARLAMIEEQISEIEKARQARVREAKARARAGQEVDEIEARVLKLTGLRGVGPATAWTLTTELFAWRQIKNRRQLGRLAGLTATPYDSGSMSREQGIDKAGNPRVRRLMIEISWLWLRLQPDSKLSRWFQRRFVETKRHRRVGITALARKLLIALWRYCEQDVVPEGALLKRCA